MTSDVEEGLGRRDVWDKGDTHQLVCVLGAALQMYLATIHVVILHSADVDSRKSFSNIRQLKTILVE